VEIRELLDFLNVAEKLKCNTRHCYTSTGRHESVAEHSWRLALMAFLVKDEFPDINIDKVIRMCIFHDIGEAKTGDIPAFQKTQQYEEVERNVVSKIFEGLPEHYKDELDILFEEMDEQKTTEAKLYKALDKLEALIQHNESDISTWLPLEYDLQMTYGTKECSFSEYINELRNVVREDSRKKIDRNE
jgi:putative hydrolase of HD superfamily